MDFLLEKLRRNMAELSVQGDDFTRRICQLYVTFEEFLEQQKLSEKADGTNNFNDQESKLVEDSTYMVDRTIIRNRRAERGSYSEPSCYLEPIDVSFCSASSTNAVIESNMGETSAPKMSSSSAVLECSRPYDPCRYKRVHRRGYDGIRSLRTVKSARDFSERGDTEYTEYVKKRSTSETSEDLPSRVHSDGERDSAVFYAGTNSVDSGYKSSCPTPELSENTGNESKQTVIDRKNYARSRILMGTKVINRHSQYTDRNLEQLLYLRQSILIAMQRYEQQKSKSCPSPSFRPRSLSASTTGYQYGKPRLRHQARPHISSYPSSRTQSPSYNPRYFSTENAVDLIKRNNFSPPYSYTSTIDDRYWYSSLANLRMQQERRSWRSSSIKDTSSSSEHLTSPISPQSGGVSEVAKCMLEIVEDLRNQYFLHGDNDDVNSLSAPVTKLQGGARSIQQKVSSTSPFSATSRLGIKCRGANKTNLPDRQPKSSADYHVYEEIMYDLTGSHEDIHKPPPLPRRPDSILFSTSTYSQKFSLKSD